jgi:hypothetical protein
VLTASSLPDQTVYCNVKIELEAGELPLHLEEEPISGAYYNGRE